MQYGDPEYARKLLHWHADHTVLGHPYWMIAKNYGVCERTVSRGLAVFRATKAKLIEQARYENQRPERWGIYLYGP